MKRPPPKPPDGPFNNPFAALAGLEVKPGGVSPAEDKPTTDARSAPGRAVVRMERKGRGGKEVTVVEQLGLSEAALGEWLKALKQSLGCGGTCEGDTLVLQGDQRERVRAWLETRGVKRISVG